MPIAYGNILAFFYSRTKKSNMRKIKLDHDVDTPAGSNPILWTTRMLFVMGINFLFGSNMGFYLVWVIVSLRMGLAVPSWPFLLKTIGLNFVLSWITIKCFDYAEHTNAGGEEHEEEAEGNVEYEAFNGSMDV